MVRLITHNLLACNAKSCAPPTNFPLQFRDVSKVEIKPTELNKEFLVTIFNKLDLGALVDASRSVESLLDSSHESYNDENVSLGTPKQHKRVDLCCWVPVQLGDTSLPETIPPEQIDNPSEMSDETFQALHHALLEVRPCLSFLRRAWPSKQVETAWIQIHVKEGNMVCPSCGHLFAIKDGIPNMLLAEHEIKT